LHTTPKFRTIAMFVWWYRNKYSYKYRFLYWLARGVEHPTPFSAEVKEREGLYPYSPSGSSWPVLGRKFTLT
jgi:hypothetical protein